MVVMHQSTPLISADDDDESVKEAPAKKPTKAKAKKSTTEADGDV